MNLYYESEWQDLFAIADRSPAGMRFAVDGLWHLPPDRAVAMGRDLDARNARWLECPLYPEEVAAHAALAATGALTALNERLHVPRLGGCRGLGRTRFDAAKAKMAADALASGSPQNNSVVPATDQIVALYDESW